MKRIGPLALALAATALLVAHASASDHLVPEDTFLADYRKVVREVLKGAFVPSVRVRAIVEPSFQPEFATGLKEEAGRYSIFFIQPSAQVWNYTAIEMLKDGRMSMQNSDGSSGTAEAIKRLQAKLPADPKDLRVASCEVGIEPTLARRVIEDWTLMLDRVRPAEGSDIGLDGETYHFSLGGDAKTPEGKAWSPAKDSEPGMLVGIVYAMRDYCRSRQPERVADLEKLSRALQEELREDTH